MIRLIGLALITLTALSNIASAAPADAVIRKDVAVRYSDLDLNSEAGARMMLTRISMAARQACGGAAFAYPSYSISPMLAQSDFARCQADAVARAVIALNRPALSRVYAQASEAQLRVAGR